MLPRTLTTAALAVLLLAGLAGCTNPPDESGDGTGDGGNDGNGGSDGGSEGGSDGGEDFDFGSHTGGTVRSNEINQAGSSTVFPLAEAWAEEFGGERNVQVKVAGGGSTVGATKLCGKEVDLGDMSRVMRDSEKTTCRGNGVEPVEWKVAYDALSVVVSPQNDFVKDLSVAQLKFIFQGSGHAKKWNEVDPAFPATDIDLCIPGSESGTLEYFREAILGSTSAAYRTGEGVQQNEDDNVLVTCVKGNKDAIGYFGLAYVLANPGEIEAIKVAGVAPSESTVVEGTYKPLSRFLYIYTNGVPKDNLLSDYLNYVLGTDGGQAIVHEVGYVKLDPTTQQAMQAQLGA